MDEDLVKLIQRDTPPLNPTLARGLAYAMSRTTPEFVVDARAAATSVSNKIEEYLNEALKSASFPAHMVYRGFKRCNPEEEFRIITRADMTASQRKHHRRTFSVDRSDMYLVALHFDYYGRALPPHYVYLPFISEGGHLWINGSRFTVSPVLMDPIISVRGETIFIRLLKAKITFKRTLGHYVTNTVPKWIQLIYSNNIHNATSSGKKAGARTTLGHYLFARFGVTDTFLKYAGCRIVAGGVEVNHNVYTEDEWVIYGSRQLPPKNANRKTYVPTMLRIAVKRADVNPMVEQLVGCLFYAADYFPSRVVPEDLDRTVLWRILLGKMMWPEEYHEGRLQYRVDAHMVSLDTYMDAFSTNKLMEIGYPVDNFYGLLGMVMTSFNEWLYAQHDLESSMYNKELNVLSFLLSGLVMGINRLAYFLVKQRPKPLATEQVVQAMWKFINRYAVFKITSGHGEVSSSGYSGDNMAFKTTSKLIPAFKSVRYKDYRPFEPSVNDPIQIAHVSLAEVGGYTSMTKAETYGRNKLNLHIEFDPLRYVVTPNPKHKALLDSVQELIKRSSNKK